MAGSTASVSGEYGFFVVLFVKRQVSVGNCSLVEMFRRRFFFSVYLHHFWRFLSTNIIFRFCCVFPLEQTSSSSRHKNRSRSRSTSRRRQSKHARDRSTSRSSRHNSREDYSDYESDGSNTTTDTTKRRRIDRDRDKRQQQPPKSVEIVQRVIPNWNQLTPSENRMASSRQTTLGLDGKTHYVKVGSYFVKNGQTKADVEII